MPQEPSNETLLRSTGLLSRTESGLVVIDAQEKLMPAIIETETLAWNLTRLLDGAAALRISSWVTEQYPKGLGPSIASVGQRTSHPIEKRRFSAAFDLAPRLEEGEDSAPRQLILAGIETHICVLQTAIDMLSLGYQVAIVADACGSRHLRDHDLGLRRMEANGVDIVTVESVLFEWCETSTAPEFKTISQLVTSSPPPANTSP